MGMHGDHGGHDADLAWSRFRVRLADRLAAFEDDEVLLVEVQVGVDDHELEGAAPYLQFCGWGGDQIRAEVASNAYLDERFALDSDEQERLHQTWWGPDDEAPNFHQDVERREADRLAVQAVAALRDIYGVLHPSFLDADGLEPEPQPLPGVASDEAAVGLDPDATTLPHSHDELQALVDAALAEVLESVDHDEDGDVPIRSGQSVVFVRVLPDRPGVEVFAELVVEPTQLDRVPIELDILNRTHPMARFATNGTSVRMSHTIPAWPFVPRLLNLLVGQFLEDVDDLARDLTARVGGRRFLEEPEPERQGSVEPPHPGLVGLVELLELGPVASPVVAHLFDHDRSAIIAHLVGIRTGRVDLAGLGDEVDEERVLTCLRRGLRHVVDGEVPERRRRRLPPRPRTEQPSLLTDDDAGEATLDLGHSA